MRTIKLYWGRGTETATKGARSQRASGPLLRQFPESEEVRDKKLKIKRKLYEKTGVGFGRMCYNVVEKMRY